MSSSNRVGSIIEEDEGKEALERDQYEDQTGRDQDRDRDLLTSSSSQISPSSSSPSSPSSAQVPSPSVGLTGRQQHRDKGQQNPPASTRTPSPDMSKLSDAVKALINAGHAKPGYTRAGPQVKPALERLASDAGEKRVGLPAWVTVSTAVSATMNCPEAMTEVFHLANSRNPQTRRTPVQNAELIREVGLKCISFNGIPRSINTLGAFRNSLPADVASSLSTAPTREFTPTNVETRKRDGLALWDSVYLGFERKLLDKLAQSHPDLPVHIINGHYANLLGNPRDVGKEKEAVGRVLTSLVAIACLRAQSGVGPQVVSHVFGLRKAYENGDAHADSEVPVEGGEWLATDDGNLWLLESVDRLIHAIGGSEGTTFAPGIRPKL